MISMITNMKFDLPCDLSDRICGFVVILIDAIRKYLIGHQMVEALWVYAFRFVANFHCGIYGHSESAVLNIADAKTACKIKEERFTSDLALFWSQTKHWDPSQRQTFVEYINCQLCGTISQFRLTRSIFPAMRTAVYNCISDCVQCCYHQVTFSWLQSWYMTKVSFLQSW